MDYYLKHNTHKEHKNFMFYVRHFSRIFIGILFIFSGYVKAVDPFGGALKFEEYFASFGMDFFAPLSMAFSLLLNAAEFVIGFALLFGIQMQLFAWALLLFMAFFTLLTFWLAYDLDIVNLINSVFNTNYQIFVVTDCGCFGDFITLSNKETFYKNIFFLFFTLIILIERNRYKKQSLLYITQWFPLLIGIIVVFFIQIHCLRHEPWHDFRPWKKGNFIAAETYSEAPKMDYVFLYKHNKNKSIKELNVDELMKLSEDSLKSIEFENNYTYVDRTEKIITPGINAKLADFSIIDITNNTDLKESIIEQNGYHFILIIHDISKANLSNFDEINELATQCINNSIPFIAVTGSTIKEIEEFKTKHKIDFHFYFSDETPLKTAIRNNPGLVLLNDGYVVEKWSFRDIPSYDTFQLSIDKYNQKIKRYKIKKPPILPNGLNLDSIHHMKSINIPDSITHE